ncbi:MAG: hypothetical protein HN919_18345 [Verrucomicrobia bacterium]|jgi:aryl-alcohol dehydrogenase-like predicted oxidoreductase|nr:hypothetical protein [Verrucomicrobiota bacterium]MBT7701477.1 hypothetical protein [Verrucomicrobiota bacterium]
MRTDRRSVMKSVAIAAVAGAAAGEVKAMEKRASAVKSPVAPYQTLHEVAIRFSMHPSAITSTIIGATSTRQLRANPGVLDLPEPTSPIAARKSWLR